MNTMPESERETMKRWANNLESYLEILDTKMIIEGITQEQYDTAKKECKKLIKQLKKGKSKALDVETYYTLKEEGLLES